MGPWRSPVAHLHGMQGVRGSNPLGSTEVRIAPLVRSSGAILRSQTRLWRTGAGQSGQTEAAPGSDWAAPASIGPAISTVRSPS